MVSSFRYKIDSNRGMPKLQSSPLKHLKPISLPSKRINSNIRSIVPTFGLKRFGGARDWDFDGVPNKKDCQPRNTMRQDDQKRFHRERGPDIPSEPRYTKPSPPDTQDLMESQRFFPNKKYKPINDYINAENTREFLQHEVEEDD